MGRARPRGRPHAPPAPPQPGSPAPRDGQFGQMFQSGHRWSHPSPAPPSTASAPSLGAEQQGFGKDKCVSPPSVTINTHDSARGQSVGSCSAPGVARNTGVRGCPCVSSKTCIPPAWEQAGSIPQRGDAKSPHAGGFHAGRAAPPRCPSPPGPAPGSSRGASGAQAVKPRGRSSPAHTYSCCGNIQPQDMAAPETRLLCFPSLLCHRHSWVPLVSAVPVPVSPSPWESRTCSRRDRTAPVLLAKVHRK